MNKDKKNNSKIKTTKIFQGWATIIGAIIASFIVGYFAVQANIQPVKIQINATQTAEAKLIKTPGSKLTDIAAQDQLALKQQAFATEVRMTEQSLEATATAFADIIQLSTPSPTLKPTSTPVSAIGNDIPSIFEKNYLLLLLWFLIALSNKTKRNDLFRRFLNLLSKPIIFETDEGEAETLYPRASLEKFSSIMQKFSFSSVFDKVLNSMIDFIKINTQSKPQVLFSHFVKLAFFASFVFADAISVANTLSVLLPTLGNIPSYLTQYSYTVISGSVFSLMIGGWLLFEEISQNKNTSRTKFAKGIVVISAYFLIISGLVISLVFTLARYSTFGVLPIAIQSIIVQYDYIILLVVIPVNNIIASFVLVNEAFVGSLLLICIVFVTMTNLFDFVFRVMSSVFSIFVDMVFRFNIIYLSFASFLIISPLDSIIEVVRKIYSTIFDEKR